MGLQTSSPITIPVNISHHLLSPGLLLAADVGRGAAIAVTATGQRLNSGGAPVEMGTAPIFHDSYGNRSVSFMIDQTRLRGCAAGVTHLKIFAMCSQLFVTGRKKLINC